MAMGSASSVHNDERIGTRQGHKVLLLFLAEQREIPMALDPQNVPLSAFDDEDLFHLLTDGRQNPDRDPAWLEELEAECAERWPHFADA
jgi:hypothetical protein